MAKTIDLRTKFSGEYFDGINNRVFELMIEANSSKIVLERILVELKENNKLLRKIYAH